MTPPKPDLGLAADGSAAAERLSAWLDQVLGETDLTRLTPVRGGASNLIFRIDRGGRSYCLRHPPLESNDPTANQLSREMRLLAALGQTRVPHPRLVSTCENPAIIGVPFMLMDWVEGFAGKDPLPGPYAHDPVRRRDMALALVDTLATVSNVDWRAIGLEGFGKPDGFLGRQVDRWLGQLERCRSRPLAHLDEVAAWLRAALPQTQRPALIHGDYQFINVMFAPAPPTRIAAVVDWESATIGDPMLDLGWMLATWVEPGEDMSHAPYIGWQDFPGRQEIAERYGDRTGLDASGYGFYMVLALFKLAIIMEGWFLQHQRGLSSHPEHARMETEVPAMLRRAAGFAGIA